MNRVKDGPVCHGCGLPNYEGLCPHCRGAEDEFHEMWPPASLEDRVWGAAMEGADFADGDVTQRPTHDHPRPFCGQGCPAFGDVFASYPRQSKPTPRPRKAPSRLRSKPNPIPPFVRATVLELYGYQCQWCREQGGALDLHHLKARSAGGRDEWGNLKPVHRKCHRYIHEHPSEARRRGLIVATGAKP